MRFWQPIELTAVRRPVLLPDETDVLVQGHVGIYEGRQPLEGYQNGRIYLTTHRVCYVDAAHPLTRSVAVPLSRVNRVQFAPALMKASPRLTLFFHTDNMFVVSPAGRPRSPFGTRSRPAATRAVSGAGATAPVVAPATWICQICSFANPLRADARLPPCLACGLKPSRDVYEAARAGSPVIAPAALAAAPVVETAPPAAGFECPRCTFINHPALPACELCGASLVSSNVPPALLSSAFSEMLIEDDRSRSPPASRTGIEVAELQNYVRLSLRGGGEKVFVEKLNMVLARKMWIRPHARGRSPTPKPPTPLTGTREATPEPADDDDDDGAGDVRVSGPKLGIFTLETRSQHARQRNEDLLGSLHDLHSLMAKAKEMVTLAETFAQRLSTAPGVPEEARLALLQSSTALGLSSPVVMREVAGGEDHVFHSELARQIAEFLDSGVLRREGGTITLFDLFALYNKARGISLISPTDLQKACALMHRLHLPFRLRRFKSGVLVIQAAFKSNEANAAQVTAWIKASYAHDAAYAGATPHDVHVHFGWSVIVAIEELEAAESRGDLCRDAPIEGSRFFPNLITAAAA
ncbi:EAP30/Vps36 family-domain-containing protein [Dipodascopsis tothii]|uniref:EAP30/Vps36 family-domain-containing protein n=1 Tax=Dipodascopsis tothii TaxID=44089 RepID=UPI0034CEE8D6